MRTGTYALLLASLACLSACTELKDGLDESAEGLSKAGRSSVASPASECDGAGGGACDTAARQAITNTAGAAAMGQSAPSGGKTGSAAAGKPVAAGRGGSMAGSSAAPKAGAGGMGGDEPSPPTSPEACVPGTSPEKACDIGELSNYQRKGQLVGPAQSEHYYKFSLKNNATLTYGGTNVSGSVTVQLFPKTDLPNKAMPYDYVQAANADGVKDIQLEAGAYYVRVAPQSQQNSIYDLNLVAKAYAYAEPDPEPGDERSEAADLGTLTKLVEYGGYVGGTDKVDFYRFELKSNASFRMSIDNVLGDVVVGLYADAAVLDTAKYIKQVSAGEAGATFDATQPAGVYLIRVVPYGNSNDLYKLAISPNGQ